MSENQRFTVMARVAIWQEKTVRAASVEEAIRIAHQDSGWEHITDVDACPLNEVEVYDDEGDLVYNGDGDV